MRTSVVAVLVAVTLALTGCQGPTAAAPTPVRSTDLTSSDGGFAEDAVVGAVLAPGDDALAEDLERGLDGAGFEPDVRVRLGTLRAGTLRPGTLRPSRPAPSTRSSEPGRRRCSCTPSMPTRSGAVQTAHDAGVVVVSVGDPVPTSGTGATASRPTTACPRQRMPGTPPGRPSRSSGRCSAASSRTRPTDGTCVAGPSGSARADPGVGSAQCHQAGNDRVIVSTRDLRERRGPASQASIAPTKPWATNRPRRRRAGAGVSQGRARGCAARSRPSGAARAAGAGRRPRCPGVRGRRCRGGRRRARRRRRCCAA